MSDKTIKFILNLTTIIGIATLLTVGIYQFHKTEQLKIQRDMMGKFEVFDNE